jgi:multidrug transporter EmrE-like cation transporter
MDVNGAGSWRQTWNHPPRWLGWFQVFITIIGNVIGGSLLDKSDGFTRIPFALGATASYLIGFYFLAVAMRSLPVSTSYPVQIAGVISGTAFVGIVLYNDSVNVAKVIAIVLIIIGAAVLEYTPELRAELEPVQPSQPAEMPGKQLRKRVTGSVQGDSDA